MSKKPRISPRIKAFISEEALKERDKPRNILADELKEKIDNSGMGRSPAHETLVRIISNTRAHVDSQEDEDKPWSIANYQ